MHFNAVAGAAIGAVARPLALPVFLALQLRKHANASLDTTPPNFWDTFKDGAEYAVGYYVGTWLMNSLFGAQ